MISIWRKKPAHRSPLDQRGDDGFDFAVGQAGVSYPMQFMAEHLGIQAQQFGQLFLRFARQRTVGAKWNYTLTTPDVGT